MHGTSYFSPCRESYISFILGRGYESPIVFSFNFRKSRTILHFIFPWESGFLGTIHTGVLYGDCEGLIILFFYNSSTCLVISSLWTGGNLYCLEKSEASSTVGIECCNTLVASSGSPGIWNLSAFFLINFSTCSYSSWFKWSNRRSFLIHSTLSSSVTL